MLNYAGHENEQGILEPTPIKYTKAQRKLNTARRFNSVNRISIMSKSFSLFCSICSLLDIHPNNTQFSMQLKQALIQRNDNLQ